jgi:hypothetical protein
MSERSGAVRAAAKTFLAGGALIAVVLAITLSDSSPARTVLIGPPGVKAIGEFGAQVLGRTSSEPVLCQTGETLPGGVSAIRVSLWGFFGAHVHLFLYQGSRLLAQGSRTADWTGSSVTVPVAPLSHSVSGVRVCVAVGPNSEPLNLLGTETSQQQSAIALFTKTLVSHTALASVPAGDGVPAGGRLAIEYVRPAQGSWWSRILTVARHMGLGRAYSGTWIALLVFALMAGAFALAVRLTLRELR